MKKNISYVCDRLKCERCSYPQCERTLDIKHAKNFMVFYSCDGEVLGAAEIAEDLEEFEKGLDENNVPIFRNKRLNINRK